MRRIQNATSGSGHNKDQERRRESDRISKLDNGGWLGLAIIWTAFCIGVVTAWAVFA